ncbi:MAG: zinc ribbon domain-containing protein [Haloglomus sp.]
MRAETSDNWSFCRSCNTSLGDAESADQKLIVRNDGEDVDRSEFVDEATGRAKCGHTDAAVDDIATTGNDMSRALEIESRRFKAVSCTRCGFTELYRGQRPNEARAVSAVKYLGRREFQTVTRGGRMNWGRISSSGVISLTGLGLLLIAVERILGGLAGIAGMIMTGATLVLGGAFGIGGVFIYRSDVDSDHLLRVASWNLLGVVATTAVLGLVVTFQTASGGRVVAPLLSGAVIVGVSAFAHVLIGFNDVRRIRAQTVAKQRQKAAVVNRFVRHDLSHVAQLLLGYAGQLRTDGGTEATAVNDLGQKIETVGQELAETQSRIDLVDELLERDPAREPVDVTQLLENERAEWQEAYPDATVTLDLDPGLTIRAGEHIETAVTELVENAIEHGGDPPEVTIRGSRTDGTVQIEILDDGEGIPEIERILINEDQVETQLHHSSGLGLWLAKWIVEYYDARIAVATRASGGAKVTLAFPGG